MHYDTDEKKWALREEILKRNADMHPNRAKILDDLGEKWAATGNWQMRKDIGTAATKIRDAAEVIAESEDYDPWQVAESMIELRDEFEMFLGLMMVATGEIPPPHDFGHNAEVRHGAKDADPTRNFPAVASTVLLAVRGASETPNENEHTNPSARLLWPPKWTRRNPRHHPPPPLQSGCPAKALGHAARETDAGAG